MTCSLLGSAITVTGALLGLVAKGDELVAGLQPQLVENAIKDQAASTASLKEVRADITAVLAGATTPQDYKAALDDVKTALTAARKSVTATVDATGTARSKVDVLRKKLEAISETATDARSELTDGTFPKGSMTFQVQQLAEELCNLSDDNFPRGGRLDAAEGGTPALLPDGCSVRSHRGRKDRTGQDQAAGRFRGTA